MLKFIYYSITLLTALVTVAGTIPAFVEIQNKSTGLSLKSSPTEKISTPPKAAKTDNYTLWQLGNSGLSKVAFDYAMKGFGYLTKTKLITKKSIVSIVDFSKPSTQKRLYVIDLGSGKILFNTWVAHGCNSGNEYASQFSNSPESHQSSLGFYITMDTYTGGNGYSLRLKGCEKGINDNAFERAIVIHGADYVSNRFITDRGELGRSYGCPAIPTEMSKKIINVIKNGSCLFLYHPTKKYCSRSRILNR